VTLTFEFSSFSTTQFLEFRSSMIVFVEVKVGLTSMGKDFPAIFFVNDGIDFISLSASSTLAPELS
jgi:hypothetical protein